MARRAYALNKVLGHRRAFRTLGSAGPTIPRRVGPEFRASPRRQGTDPHRAIVRDVHIHRVDHVTLWPDDPACMLTC